MYILMELSSTSPHYNIWNYDCMGYTTLESDAMNWVRQNSDYREYKYCPNKEINDEE